ncbi:PrsW family intramembrane metalloprotease [Corynebacterium mastitidis]|uniref:PrsW family intramembrane metalloprotease n=1 Tax=Corynebacterium mastitidis TaxID=161890 RepID=A0A2N0X4Z5_9CORY|nr:PrsW family intramembrane metalloprotease [Corynebacterium mastitidis]MCH6197064.1 PrsW family intramembrane metalloprotease [Corynebacterium mastitidis]PKF67783.1 PrsW family intramembrane metalloprotease [Corynebacterium mastitidis]
MNRLSAISLGIATVLGLGAMAFQLLTALIISPVSLGIGAGLGLLYVFLVVLLLSRSPMWPRGAHLWALPALVWGGGVSLGLATTVGLPVSEIPEKLGWDLVAASIGGAYPEEFSKALGVAIILLSFRRLNRPWHGLIVGAVVGLGFETIENLVYGLTGAILDPNSDTAGALGLWGLRLLAGPCLHIIFTGIAGWGIGLALYTAEVSLMWRLGRVLGWFLVAFGLHFSWNLLYGNEAAQIVNMIAVALVMYPLAVWLFIRGNRRARRDDTYAYTERPLRTVAEAVAVGGCGASATAAAPAARSAQTPPR